MGDKLYNGDPTVFMRFKDMIATNEDHDLMQLPRHALHALAQRIPFPSLENPSLFKSQIPVDFKNWLLKKVPHLDHKEMEDKINLKLKDHFHVEQ